MTDPWAARIAVVIGDTWQWTPFVFIVLLAALEGLDLEVREAAFVDGASTLAGRSATSRCRRSCRSARRSSSSGMIEGFKIIDMPNILTGGGPGHRDPVADARGVPRLADAEPRQIGGDRLHPADPRDDHRARPTSAWSRRRVRSSEPMQQPAATPLAARPVAARRSSSSYILLIGWSFVVLFPLYWLAVTSFKLPVQVDKGPFYIPFVDFQPTLDAWKYILVDLGNDTIRPYINTVIVGFSSALIALLMGSAAAYALVRFTYRPRVGIIALGRVAMVGAFAAILGGVPWPLAVASALARLR